VIIVRFADDFVAGFEHQADAQQFLSDLREDSGDFVHPIRSFRTPRLTVGIGGLEETDAAPWFTSSIGSL